MAIEPQSAAQSKVEGWFILEIYGHSKAAGYLTTEYFGSTAMFRLDTPELPERDFELSRPEWRTINGKYAEWPAGTKVQRPASPARTELLGMGSIFRMHPCTKEVVEAAIEELYPRPLMLLSMPEKVQLPEHRMAIDPVCGSEVDPAEVGTRSYEFKGQTYYFCTKDCRDEFEDNPQDYI